MKNITFLKRAAGFFAAVSFLTGTAFAGSIKSADEGTVNVSIMDEHGQVVPDAPVYIYGEHKTHFVGGRNVPGSMTFAMKPGEYKISSAMAQKDGPYLDRFASEEAHVRVVAGDNVSVILTLKTLNQDAGHVSYCTLHLASVPSLLIN